MEVSSHRNMWQTPLPASELLDNQLPLHIPAEPVHLEHFTVIEGREVVDVDLPSLGGRGRGEVNVYFKKIRTMCFSTAEDAENLTVSNLCSAQQEPELQ